MHNDRTVDMLLLFILSDNWGVGTLSFLRKTPLYLTPGGGFLGGRVSLRVVRLFPTLPIL